MIGTIGLVSGAIAGFGVLIGLSWYRIVKPSEVHVVVMPGKTVVFSSDLSLQKSKHQGAGTVEGTKGKIIRPDNEFLGGRWYFQIPLIFNVRKLDMTIKELVNTMETYEKDQGRYSVKYSIKYRIMNPLRASETFLDDATLQEQLNEVVQAGVRAITVKYPVTEARAKKKLMSDEIEKEIGDDLEKWGLELVNFVLVDFQDTKDSHIISDISAQREKSIESETRQVNAGYEKEAKVKEANADEEAKKREIERDQKVAIYTEDKNKIVFEKKKDVKIAELDVTKTEQVTMATIAKEKAIIEVNQRKEVSKVNKETLLLEGEGEKLKAIELAKGKASETREMGLAEAEAKEKLQTALNKFTERAIQALVAEKLVDMQKEIGVKTAEALGKADLKVFSGGSNQSGFDLAQVLTSLNHANEDATKAVLNRIARPNDLGLGAGFSVSVGKEKENKQTESETLN